MDGQKLAIATFVIEFTDYEDVTVDMTLFRTREDDYGNKTITVMKERGCAPEYLDTRYDVTLRRDGHNFFEWCKKYFRDRFGDRLIRATMTEGYKVAS